MTIGEGLLDEYETMLNVGLGAEAIAAYVSAFGEVENRPEPVVNLWHVITVLPLVFHEASRRAITIHRQSSGLRSVLEREPQHDIAQSEAIFNLNRRIRAMHGRTTRSLNCGLSWGLIKPEDGGFIVIKRYRLRTALTGEARNIVAAAAKLGTWAGQISSFEYFTILGVELTA